MSKTEEYRALRDKNPFAARRFYLTHRADLDNEFNTEDGITAEPAAPAPTAEQIAADAAALQQYRAITNPFTASRCFTNHRDAITRAMQRETETDDTTPPQAA